MKLLLIEKLINKNYMLFKKIKNKNYMKNLQSTLSTMVDVH